MSGFKEAWDLIPKPLGGNKKGYKKGFKDGFEARDSEVNDLKAGLKDLIGAIEPVLLGGYDRQVMIENLKEKYKL